MKTQQSKARNEFATNSATAGTTRVENIYDPDDPVFPTSSSPKNPARLTGTKEWAPFNCNVVKGCSHDCAYCFSKAMAIRFKRKTPDTWPTEEPYLHMARQMARKKPTRIMFPSTHDITPGCLDVCLQALDLMLTAGHQLLIVSKPHLACVTEICRRFAGFKAKILFRFTIGSLDSDILRFWEPHAPDADERLASLEYAHSLGFQTSISCEPMLDANAASVVSTVLPHLTETIWLGKANMLRQRLRVNGVLTPEVAARADALIDSQNNTAIGELYASLSHHPQIRWKESVKDVVGLPLLVPDRGKALCRTVG
ncbi:MAG: radical SAM protein [Lentisphaerae bacterium]|jgi:DNA repair photolyase|nr:radical SAM protein [Lentisphaerota bacterium]